MPQHHSSCFSKFHEHLVCIYWGHSRQYIGYTSTLSLHRQGDSRDTPRSPSVTGLVIRIRSQPVPQQTQCFQEERVPPPLIHFPTTLFLCLHTWSSRRRSQARGNQDWQATPSSTRGELCEQAVKESSSLISGSTDRCSLACTYQVAAAGLYQQDGPRLQCLSELGQDLWLQGTTWSGSRLLACLLTTVTAIEL